MINNIIGKEMELYDSANNNTVIVDKAIDISAICPKSKQCIIKYATVSRGRIAQICDLYENGKDLGSTVHYHINEFTNDSLSMDIVFERTASVLGVNASVLSNIIFNNQ